jgi:predicted dehydrogenase
MSDRLSRRDFLRKGIVAGTLYAVPLVVPYSVFGAAAPSNRVTIGAIGIGRQCFEADLPEILGFKDVQVVAVCDVDGRRLENARRLVERTYAAKTSTGEFKGCDTYRDFRELLARRDIDAVLVCPPDHWHGSIAIAAAGAGKDLFVQKPLTYTIEEGRVLSDTVRRFGRILQVGSQQRSDDKFRFACEIVRNGRIGKLHTIKIGLPQDPPTTVHPTMSVPKELDYDMWLGPAPWSAYTVKRVHPTNDYSRPGWMEVSDYCLGMIANWGAHHIDIAQWAMGTELTGPVEVEGRANFFRDGLWDVYDKFSVEYTYANGVKMIVTDDTLNKVGLLFEGDKGWVFVTRGDIDANPKELLSSVIGPNEIHLYKSNNHKANFIECIKSRGQTIAPVEVAHRSCSACILGYIAMRLGRKLKWDPQAERFVNDEQANRMLSRPMRSPWHL